jgi:hypothetical protein
VHISGSITDSDEAVVALLLRAVSGQRMYGYWRMTECCEGCVQNAQEPLRYIDAAFRQAHEAVTANETSPAAMLLAVAIEGLDEYRRYMRRVVPDRERETQWGEGEREEYLDAMHGIRHHLLGIVTQLHRLTEGRVPLPDDAARHDLWERQRYTVLDTDPDLFTQ